MFFKQGRYSGFITPISYGVDLLILNLFAYFLPINLQEVFLFHTYISLSWIIISLITEFYIIYRYTKATHILKLLFRQFFFFFLIVYAFMGFFKQPNMSRLALAQYVDFIIFDNFNFKIPQLITC